MASCLCLLSRVVGFLACSVLVALGQGSGQGSPSPADNKEITNTIGIKLVLIPAGKFRMGRLEGFASVKAHEVKISRDFYMGKFHVTRGQFGKFVETAGYKMPGGAFGFNQKSGKDEFGKNYSWRNPGFVQTDDHPVVNVAWGDAVAFCEWLSKKERKKYRLPTEAEWEYSCRARTTTRFYTGDDEESLIGAANIADASLKEKVPNLVVDLCVAWNDGYPFTSPVGSFKKANGFGLYDMHGNVLQWCQDWYDDEYYAKSPLEDPPGPKYPWGPGFSFRVVRGGAWCFGPAASAQRALHSPRQMGVAFIGFRVVLER